MATKEERKKVIDECAAIKRAMMPCTDDDSAVHATSFNLREVIEDVIKQKFDGRYIRAADVPELQKHVRAALRKKFPQALDVNLRPARGGGVEISVEGF